MFRTITSRSAGLLRRNALGYQNRFSSVSSPGGTAGGSNLVPNHLLKSWYNIFGKSTAMYATWLVMLIVVGEYTTGKMTDGLWTMNNYGKTYDTVDWSKFDEFEDEDEDEEDEDDDDDDDE